MDIIAVVISGLIGTLGMFLLMELITLSGLANADMVRALGSLVTKKQEGSFQIGVGMHLISGVIFSMIYCFLISLMPIETATVATCVGAFGGFVHGFIVSYFLVIEVAERHPLERYRKAGFEVAIAHIAGHIAFGAIVGYTFGIQTLSTVATKGAEFGLNLVQTYGMVVGILTLLAMVVVSVKRHMGHK